MNGLREDADQIIKTSIEAVLPDEAVRKALQEKFPGKRPGRWQTPLTVILAIRSERAL